MAAPTSGTSSSQDPDWGKVAADRFVDVVDNVRDKTTGPVLKIARAIVYGLVVIVSLVMMMAFERRFAVNACLRFYAVWARMRFLGILRLTLGIREVPWPVSESMEKLLLSRAQPRDWGLRVYASSRKRGRPCIVRTSMQQQCSRWQMRLAELPLPSMSPTKAPGSARCCK